MEVTNHSTRVRAPALLISSAPSLARVARMTTSAESPTREGNSPMRDGNRRQLRAPDMRCKQRIATWNVLTLSHDGYAEALSRELQRYNISLAGLTEVRLRGNGLLDIERATLLYSGGEHRVHGVGLMLNGTMKRALLGWQPISDRLMVARFQHRHGGLSVIVAYAPTEEADMAAKESFYPRLYGMRIQKEKMRPNIIKGV